MKTNLSLTLLLMIGVTATAFLSVAIAKSKGSKKEASEEEEADYEEEENEDDYEVTKRPWDSTNGTNGSLIVKPGDPRVLAEELQAKIELIHSMDSRDPVQMAEIVLTQAFLNYSQGKKEVSVATILKEASKSPPRTAMYVLRLLEIMDDNYDFKIDVHEFQGLMSGPAAKFANLLDLMFQIQDYDSDGKITRYEMLTDELLGLGVNYNLFDMWRAVTQKVAEVDLDRDQVINPAEYANSVLFQVNRALVQRRDGTLS